MEGTAQDCSDRVKNEKSLGSLGSKLPADDILETEENTCAEKPAPVPPTRLILLAVWTASVALQNTHNCVWNFPQLSFPREKGLIPQSFPRAQAAGWGWSSTDSPDPKCAPKTRVWDVSRTQPSLLSREFGTAPLSCCFVGIGREDWPWQILWQPQKCLRICISESFYLHVISAYKYLLSLFLFFFLSIHARIGTPYGELLMFVGIGTRWSLRALSTQDFDNSKIKSRSRKQQFLSWWGWTLSV